MKERTKQENLDFQILAKWLWGPLRTLATRRGLGEVHCSFS